MEDIKISFNIENVFSAEPLIFNLSIIGDSWTLVCRLNEFLLFPASKLKEVLRLIARSQDAPKGFSICKMCLDYLLSLYDNEEGKNKAELKKIKACYRYIDNASYLYKFYTEGS